MHNVFKLESSAAKLLASLALLGGSAIGAGRTAQAVSFTVGSNFSATNILQSGFIPPDTMGAVGPNHVAVMINGRYSVYSKAGALQQSVSLDSFWASAGATPSGSFAFDPRILYDKPSGRWFAAAVDNAGGPNNFLLGVSATDNPTGAWSGFKIDADSNNLEWADFPMLGVNNDVVTLSANMFPVSAGGSSVSFLVVPKADLLQPVPTAANRTLFENVASNLTGFSVQPAVDLTNGSMPLGLLSEQKSFGALKMSSIGGTANAPILNTAGGVINVTPRSAPPSIDQPGLKANIDASNSRFSGNVIVQQTPGRADKSVWSVHSVNVGGRAAIEWYEINAATNAVLQSGVISHATLGFNYPSISVNEDGVVVIGFSGASSSKFMSTYVVVGETVAGVTTFGPVTITKAGVSDYELLDNNLRNRWGDYSATVLDPVDKYSFWTFQEFVSATDQWQIQVTQIVVPEPSSIILAGVALAGLAVTVVLRRRDKLSEGPARKRNLSALASLCISTMQKAGLC
jgi:hypothetical protein